MEFKGFSLGKKAAAPQAVRVQEKEHERVDLVGSIAGNRIESLNAEPVEGPLVIPMPAPRMQVSDKHQKLVRRRAHLAKDSEPPPLENGENGVSPSKRQRVDDVDMEDGDADGAPRAATAATAASSAALDSFQGEDREAVEALLKQARGEIDEDEKAASDFVLPLLLQNRDPTLDRFTDEADVFKADVASRPDEASLDDYERIPIDAFGTALLRGMDWAPGRPVGLTNKAVVAPVEFLKRAGYRTGLGAVAKPEAKKKGRAKPGDKVRETMVLPESADGRVRHVRSIDEKLVPISKRGVHEGSAVSIVAGQHEGLSGRVTRLDDAQDRVTVRLAASNEDVVVSKSDLMLLAHHRKHAKHQSSSDAASSATSASSESDEDESDDELDAQDAEPAARTPSAATIKREPASERRSAAVKAESRDSSSRPSSSASERRRDERDESSRRSDRDKDRDPELERDRGKDRGKDGKDRGNDGKDRDRGGKEKERDRDARGSGSSGKQKEAAGWLRAHLLVRVVSKSLHGGKFYLKKGSIVDVIGHQTCSVQVEGRLVEAKQSMLETVIPKAAGAKVMIVEGPDRGRLGRLVEKSKDKGQERAVVQLAGSMSVKAYDFDFVCEFTGDDGMD